MLDHRKPARLSAALHGFFDAPLDQILGRSRAVDPAGAALALFRDVAASVPAYGAFLAEQGVDPAAVLTPTDFARLPPAAPRCDVVADAIVAELLRVNSEFGAYTPAEYRRPRVTLLPAGHLDWFPPGVKHRYTRG